MHRDILMCKELHLNFLLRKLLMKQLTTTIKMMTMTYIYLFIYLFKMKNEIGS